MAGVIGTSDRGQAIAIAVSAPPPCGPGALGAAPIPDSPPRDTSGAATPPAAGRPAGHGPDRDGGGRG